MAITNFAAAVKAGKAHLEGGRPDLAAFLFGQVLEGDPTHPAALTGLASVLIHMGQSAEAAQLLQAGLQAHPDDPDMRANRGSLYMLLKDFDGALRCYDEVLAADPDNPGFLVNRGNALMGLDRHAEAMESFQRAAAADPGYAGAHLNIGLLRMMLDPAGNAEAAEADFLRALDCDPALVGAWTNLSALRSLRGDLEGAREAAEQALIQAPHLLENHLAFARTLYALDRLADARKLLEKLRLVNAELPGTEVLLAQIAMDEERPAAAIAHLHRAAELRPQDAAIWANLAALMHRQGRIEQADDALDRALSLEPDNAAARLHKGRILLADGRLEQGLAYLDAMYDLPALAAEAPFNRLKGSEPAWNGAELSAALPHGGHLVLAPEADDSLTWLMLRFVAAARTRVGRITFLDFRGMAPLLERVAGIDAVVPVAPSADVPCDAITRLGALPGLLSASQPDLLEAPGAAVPYLSPPPRLAQEWKAKIGQGNLPSVGLIWSPHGKPAAGDERALPLAQAERLLQVPNLRFVSLQFGQAEGDLDGLAQGGGLARLGNQVTTPADLAAAIAAVDLLVSVDGPAADMAGAMGLRAWLLLPHVAEWRWAQRDGQCLWYPTLTAFRQNRPGDWESAVAAAARALERLVGG